MLTTNQIQILLDSMIEILELPDISYEKAKIRYEDISKWLTREGSSCANYNPHIFPQGSFRLGTAIRPLNRKDEYDLDLTCKLQSGYTKDVFTQEDLKKLIGMEIESYRKFRGIESSIQQKHRCWRLDYQDDLSFHMDIVPCVPEEEFRRTQISESLKKIGIYEELASSIAQESVSITDDRHPMYKQIDRNWNISNPQGYAKWFEYRIKQGLYEKRYLAKGQVDEIPLYKRKAPLQRVIQILKRHRDQMFKDNEEVKPISIIITTLAARAYQGEPDIEAALRSVLSKMGNFINHEKPRVPNPVNASEDFTDRWSMPQYKHLNLEHNFRNWLTQAQADFENICSSDNTKFISEQISRKYSLNIDNSTLNKKLGISSSTISVIAPKKHSIPSQPAGPWKTT